MITRPQAFSDWSQPVRELLDADPSGAFAVVFPEYRPELVKALAHDLDLDYFDFRSEIMAPLGWQASTLELADLDRELGQRSEQGGLVAQNVEALLSTKDRPSREAWLSDLLRRRYPAPVLVPVVLYADALAAGRHRVCVLVPGDLPEPSPLMRLLS